MASFFRCVMTQATYTLPNGQDTTTPLPFSVGAMQANGWADQSYSGQIQIASQVDEDTHTLVQVINAFGQPAPGNVLQMVNGQAQGKAVFKILKTYAPGPWLDVAVKASNPDGTIVGGSANHTRVALPATVTAHVVALLQNWQELGSVTLATLDGLVLTVDGKPVWAPPTSPFAGRTGQFG